MCAILHFSTLQFICFLELSLRNEVSPQFFTTRPYSHAAKWLSFSKFHFLLIQLLLQIVLNPLNSVCPSTDSGGICVSCSFFFS